MEMINIIFGVLTIWMVILTIVVFRVTTHYNRLTQGITTHSLKDALEKILDEHMKNRKDVAVLKQAFAELKKEETYHFQKAGIVRFNPFSDTGGSQSFTMALLDGQNSGILLTSLYARTGNRWYIKHIKDGKGSGVELSREEETAIREAKRLSDSNS